MKRLFFGSKNEAFFSIQQLRNLAGKKNFKPYKRNPILKPGKNGTWDAGALGSMTIVMVNDLFHLYYEAWGIRSKKHWSQEEYNSLQIGHATSKDGIHWIKDPNNPVIQKGKEENAWDHDGCWDPFILYENGVFKMWYGGGNKVCDWGYATSIDGIHFTKHGPISHLGKVEDDHIVHDLKNHQYHIYYWDRAHEPMGLFHARSKNETDFDFQNAQIIKIEQEEYPKMYKFTHVIIEEKTWYMFYSDFLRPHCPRSKVRLAISKDGAQWTAVNKNLLEGHDSEIIKVSDDLYLMYYGPKNHFDAAECDIRVALFNGKLDSLIKTD
jgi:hypothetical protein